MKRSARTGASPSHAAHSGRNPDRLAGWLHQRRKSTLLNLCPGLMFMSPTSVRHARTRPPPDRDAERALGALSDTVGFIQQLPVTLVAAFRATLEEVVEADLLLHVVDISDPHAWDQIDVVEDTLAGLDATRIPKILILNKIDRGEQALPPSLHDLGYRAIVRTSATKGRGRTIYSKPSASTFARFAGGADGADPLHAWRVVAANTRGCRPERDAHRRGVEVRRWSRPAGGASVLTESYNALL